MVRDQMLWRPSKCPNDALWAIPWAVERAREAKAVAEEANKLFRFVVAATAKLINTPQRVDSAGNNFGRMREEDLARIKSVAKQTLFSNDGAYLDEISLPAKNTNKGGNGAQSPKENLVAVSVPSHLPSLLSRLIRLIGWRIVDVGANKGFTVASYIDLLMGSGGLHNREEGGAENDGLSSGLAKASEKSDLRQILMEVTKGATRSNSSDKDKNSMSAQKRTQMWRSVQFHQRYYPASSIPAGQGTPPRSLRFDSSRTQQFITETLPKTAHPFGPQWLGAGLFQRFHQSSSKHGGSSSNSGLNVGGPPRPQPISAASANGFCGGCCECLGSDASDNDAFSLSGALRLASTYKENLRNNNANAATVIDHEIEREKGPRLCLPPALVARWAWANRPKVFKTRNIQRTKKDGRPSASKDGEDAGDESVLSREDASQLIVELVALHAFFSSENGFALTDEFICTRHQAGTATKGGASKYTRRHSSLELFRPAFLAFYAYEPALANYEWLTNFFQRRSHEKGGEAPNLPSASHSADPHTLNNSTPLPPRYFFSDLSNGIEVNIFRMAVGAEEEFDHADRRSNDRHWPVGSRDLLTRALLPPDSSSTIDKHFLHGAFPLLSSIADGDDNQRATHVFYSSEDELAEMKSLPLRHPLRGGKREPSNAKDDSNSTASTARGKLNDTSLQKNKNRKVSAKRRFVLFPDVALGSEVGAIVSGDASVSEGEKHDGQPPNDNGDSNDHKKTIDERLTPQTRLVPVEITSLDAHLLGSMMGANVEKIREDASFSSATGEEEKGAHSPRSRVVIRSGRSVQSQRFGALRVYSPLLESNAPSPSFSSSSLASYGSIPFFDHLTTDAQGHDAEVFSGASFLFSRGHIASYQLELGRRADYFSMFAGALGRTMRNWQQSDRNAAANAGNNNPFTYMCYFPTESKKGSTVPTHVRLNHGATTTTSTENDNGGDEREGSASRHGCWKKWYGTASGWINALCVIREFRYSSSSPLPSSLRGDDVGAMTSGDISVASIGNYNGDLHLSSSPISKAMHQERQRQFFALSDIMDVLEVGAAHQQAAGRCPSNAQQQRIIANMVQQTKP